MMYTTRYMCQYSGLIIRLPRRQSSIWYDLLWLFCSLLHGQRSKHGASRVMVFARANFAPGDWIQIVPCLALPSLRFHGACAVGMYNLIASNCLWSCDWQVLPPCKDSFILGCDMKLVSSWQQRQGPVCENNKVIGETRLDHKTLELTLPSPCLRLDMPETCALIMHECSTQ